MNAVRTLMSAILDYAGLFPPAKLDMAATVRNYAAYRAGTDSWMLGRLIVPASRLRELAEHAMPAWKSRPNSETWHLSALTAAAGESALEADIDAILAFNDEHGNRAIVDAIELKAGAAAAIDEALAVIPCDLTPFFELPLGGDVRGLIAALAGTDAGAKARTGGVTPDLFPPPAALAALILSCAGARVPFKVTAGLHHPFTHPSQAVAGATEFGFINAFLGATLAMKNLVTKEELGDLLADQQVSSFEFCMGSISWRGTRATVQDVERSREAFAVSYGSCSFVEPLDDLRRLNLLD